MTRPHILFMAFLLLLPIPAFSGQLPVTFTDSAGKDITLIARPERVVAMDPAIAEILGEIGADDTLVGVTYHSFRPAAAAATVVGGFSSPDLLLVEDLHPDVVFYGDLQQEAIIPLAICIRLSPRTIEESFADIRLLGRMFDRENEALALIDRQRRELRVIGEKVAAIPFPERQRVVRLMADDRPMVPGDDSFQNEYIRAAGGIAPSLGKEGQIVTVELREWQEFNPQVIYACGRSRNIPLLQQPGWRDVDAVRNQRIVFFPCELTCRLASRSGEFVAGLSAAIYGESFSREDRYVLPEDIVSRRSLSIDLPYVRQAEIVTSDIADFRNKTLVVSFTRPMTVVSTLEGQRSGITTVANHFFPPPAWGLAHPRGLAELRAVGERVLSLEGSTTAMLFTGADMDHLAVVEKSYREMRVVALVTAGVAGNAMRMGADTGGYYEPDEPGVTAKPGTINILLLGNMRLTPRAMTRAIISATEGKTAALQDLDIRSSYSGEGNAATGTGTDNVIVAEGSGRLIDNAGGHTKMGELIASAVHDGVLQAIEQQNGIVAGRSIFKRLEERDIDLSRIFHQDTALRTRVEKLLLQERYASFMAAALAISDEYRKGLIADLGAFDSWCRAMAGDREVTAPAVLGDERYGPVIGKALAALIEAGGRHRVSVAGSVGKNGQHVEAGQ